MMTRLEWRYRLGYRAAKNRSVELLGAIPEELPRPEPFEDEDGRITLPSAWWIGWTVARGGMIIEQEVARNSLT